MTAYLEELGYVHEPQPRHPTPRPQARYEGLRELGDEGWEATVRKADGRAVWLYGKNRPQVISRARNLVAVLNERRTR